MPNLPIRQKIQQHPQIAIISLVVLLVLFLYWLLVWQGRVYTNDAYVQGNQIYITALHPGFVESIHSDDTFLVRKGQLLIQLDETDARIALAAARKNLAQTVREVCQAFHLVFELRAEITAEEALLLKARQDYKHRHDVIDAQGVSLEDYEHAQDDLKARAAILERTRSRYNKAFAYVQNTSISRHPAVLAAAQRVRETWVKLYRCRIYAPNDGLVAQRTIQVGMWVKPEMPLMSIIPLDQIWVNANYKETQLKHVRIGQPATVTSDLYGAKVVFHGRVVGLPGGSGDVFSLLPPQNLSGNWIKIVQRLPVRIALKPEELQKHPLRMGLSMEVRTNIRDKEGLLIPTTNQGPLYITDIFHREEAGDEALIKQIIFANLDPNLTQYATQPFHKPGVVNKPIERKKPHVAPKHQLDSKQFTGHG